MAATDVFLNLNATTLAAARVVSSTNNQAEPWQKFVIADNRDLNLYFTDGAGAYVDVSSYTSIRVGVGGINKRPTSGSWMFTHGGNSNVVEWDITAANLELLLDSAPYSLDVAVTSPVTGVYIVRFNNVGAQTLPTTDTDGTSGPLSPDSTISVKRLVTGDGSTKEDWIIRLFQIPWAYSETWAAISNGVTGSLNFGTENLYLAMGASDSVAGYFEVELTDASANITTIVQAPVTILGPVIGDGASGSGAFELAIPKETIICSVTGESETLTTGAGKITWQMPYAMTVTAVRASVKTAPTGATIDVDINDGGTSILSTLITIDAGETSSATAATPAVISDTALADDAIMTIDVDQVGSGTAGVGLKVYITGPRA
jgi:hypothetical protein